MSHQPYIDACRNASERQDRLSVSPLRCTDVSNKNGHEILILC